MAAEPSNDENAFPATEDELEVAERLDNAMTHLARGLNSFHALGVSEHVFLQLVVLRARLRWQLNVDGNGVPTFRHWITDPARSKVRGSTSEAKASRTRASKFNRQIDRLRDDPGKRGAASAYFDCMFDAMDCVQRAREGQHTTAGTSAVVAPADGGPATTGGDRPAAVPPTDGGATSVGGVLPGVSLGELLASYAPSVVTDKLSGNPPSLDDLLRLVTSLK